MELITVDNMYYLIFSASLFLIACSWYARYFYLSVKAKGLEKFFRITLFTLMLGAAFTLMSVFTSPFLGLDLTTVLPVRGTLVSLPFLFFLIFSILLYRSRSNPNITLLKIAWVVMLCFNVGDMLLNLYLYFSWEPAVPILKNYKTLSEKMIMEHVRNPRRENYLFLLISPALWTLACGIGVYKVFRQPHL